MNLSFSTILLLCTISTVTWFFFPNALHWVSSGRRAARLDYINTWRTSLVTLICVVVLVFASHPAVAIMAILVIGPALGLHLRWLYQSWFS
jgi:hypothetical protein